jgi:hypothetical protein
MIWSAADRLYREQPQLILVQNESALQFKGCVLHGRMKEQDCTFQMAALTAFHSNGCVAGF